DSGSVRLWSRLGNEKTTQFPEIARALGTFGKTLDAPVVLDGEIVALDAKGEPTGFQQLQGRIHVHDPSNLVKASPAGGEARPSVAYIAFDVLREGRQDLRDRPLSQRRTVLERLLHGATTAMLRISEQVRGDGRQLYAQALARGWEGLIAKHAASLYKSGKRTPDWRKLKIVQEQEFVIGGWTEPRHTRSYFGALLLGVYHPSSDNAPRRQSLEYVGHTGPGFNEKELARVMALLKRLEIREPPFRERPKTNERAHWVRPDLVAQVRFTEWTADGRLRHPVYLGLRDDKKSEEVEREVPRGSRGSAGSQGSQGSRGSTHAGARRSSGSSAAASRSVVDQLQALEEARRD